MMKIIRILSLITIACFLISVESSGQVMKFTLKEAQDYAASNSYSVRNAEFDLEMANKQVKENIALGLPQLDGSVDYNYNIALPTSLIPAEFIGGQPGDYVELQFGTKNTATIGVTLRQLIFDGRYFIGLQYAKLMEVLSQQSLEKSALDIKESVTQAYFMILVGDEALKILDSTLVALEKTQFETGEMYKEGFLEQTDYDQLTLSVTDIKNSINSVKIQNELGYKLLKFQMGIPIEQEIALSETMEDIILQSATEAILDVPFNVQEHIDYRLISSQEQMKVLALKNEKSAYYPSLNALVLLQTNAQRNDFSFLDAKERWFPMSTVGISMSVPLFSSGIRKYRIDQAKIDLEKINNIKTQVEQGLLLGISQAKSEFLTALQNYMREKQNVELSGRIYRKTLVKYQEGVASSAELTQQLNQFYRSESSYFNNVRALLQAKNKLDKALGKY